MTEEVHLYLRNLQLLQRDRVGKNGLAQVCELVVSQPPGERTYKEDTAVEIEVERSFSLL